MAGEMFKMGAVSPEQAANMMSTLATAITANPAQMPDLPIQVNQGGIWYPINRFSYVTSFCLAAAAYVADQVSQMAGKSIAKEIGDKFARRIVRATSTWTLISSAPVIPGGSSGVITLSVNPDVAGLVLCDLACTRDEGQVFRATQLEIGASKLVNTDGTLSPTSVYQGASLSIWDATGAEYNDVAPEFGTVYRSKNGQPIVFTANFIHTRLFGELAVPMVVGLDFLCMVDRYPRDAAPGCANVREIMADLEQCDMRLINPAAFMPR